MGVLIAHTDPRWFATLVPGDKGAPVVELRRWPGDTILSIYALEPPFSSAAGGKPPVPGADLVLQTGASEHSEQWKGTLRTEGGDRPALWREIRVAETGPILGALLLPGDAGLGAAAMPSLLEELRILQESIVIRPEIWARKAGLERGQPILLGVTGTAPGDRDEAVDPWQVVQGTSFTLGLPPGVQARRTDAGVPPPVALGGGRLWIRGRFRDVEGQTVAIGDERVAGYVAEPESPDADWIAGKRPPVGAPTAKRSASEVFPLLQERTGATAARAERWTDPAFAGEWVVFRLLFEKRGVEIGLPVSEGRRSASLFWIPATWRDLGQAPAPPPVDPAARFGIRFERLGRVDQQKQPWMEGYLIVPGLRVEIPLGWWPAASLRSPAGYPVRLLDAEGETLGQLSRVESAAVPAMVERWETSPRPGVHRAQTVYRRPADGSRMFVAADGSGMLFEVLPGAVVPAQAWDRMLDSVQITEH